MKSVKIKQGVYVQIHSIISSSIFCSLLGNIPSAKMGIYASVRLLSSLFRVTTWHLPVLISDTLILGQYLKDFAVEVLLVLWSQGAFCKSMQFVKTFLFFFFVMEKNDHISFLTYEKCFLLGFLRSSSEVALTGWRIWSTILRFCFA